MSISLTWARARSSSTRSAGWLGYWAIQLADGGEPQRRGCARRVGVERDGELAGDGEADRAGVTGVELEFGDQCVHCGGHAGRRRCDVDEGGDAVGGAAVAAQAVVAAPVRPAPSLPCRWALCHALSVYR